MKTTLEIPDALFEQANLAAAQQGIPFQELVSQALADKLKPKEHRKKPWMESFGELRHLRDETDHINRVIEEAFENTEPEDWS